VDRFDLAGLRTMIARHASLIADDLAQIDAAVWSRRTRCAEWDVGELIQHLVTGQRFAFELLSAALEGRTAKKPSDFHADRITTIEAFGRTSRKVVEAVARVAPNLVEREVVIDDVEAVTLKHLIEVVGVEVAVHGLDLADALGHPRHLSTDEVAMIGRTLPDILDQGRAGRPNAAYMLSCVAFDVPFSWRNQAWRCEPGLDPCRIEGDPEPLLMYALGRVPFDKSGLTTNRPDAARTFKRHLRGP
jgi:uncharacterized protein (TIGR03083 family)